jgi:hypothetical protein
MTFICFTVHLHIKISPLEFQDLQIGEQCQLVG